MRYLLDVNVLVAMAFSAHRAHGAAHAWFRQKPERQWATCALTQGGFVRVAGRLMGGRGDAVANALAALDRNCQSRHHEYWPVDTDLRGLSQAMRKRLIGVNRIADMQLLMLAHRRGGKLATFDKGLNELATGTGYAQAVLILEQGALPV